MKVVLPAPPKKKVEKTKKNFVPTFKHSKKTLVSEFVTALVRPFDPTTEGCRVPDPWSFPTTTFHLHSTTVYNSSSTTSAGILFLPNPALSMVDLEALFTANSTKAITATGKTGMAQLNNTATCVGSTCYGASSQAALAAVAATYRTVSWGIKISNLAPELTATGRLIFAFAPLTATVPGYQLVAATANTLVATGSANGLLNSMIGTSNIDSSYLLSLPTAFEIAVQDLLHGDLEIAGKYTAPSFFEFRNTQPYSATPSYYEYDDVVVNNVGVVQDSMSGTKDLTSMHGGCALIMRLEGFPASIDCLQIETIYHLECQPNLGSVPTSNTPIPSSNTIHMPVGTTNILEASMSVTKDESSIVTWVKEGCDFLNRNRDDIVGGVTSVAKVVGAAMALL